MLGWTFRGSKYCELIRQQNKIKRFIWPCDNFNEAASNGFSDVIWTDETTVQLESHRHYSFRKKSINWWKTPPESPDLNSIENLWYQLKEFIRCEVKPTTKAELVKGIKQFWDTVDVPNCNKYINHLQKVVPKVILLEGAATGY